MPFIRGKLVFCHSEAKKGNKKQPPPQKTKQTKNKQKNNKEGLGPSEVALLATSPDL